MNDRAELAFRDAFAEHGAEHIEPVRAARRRFDPRWAVAAAVALVVMAVPLLLQLRGGSGTDPGVASPQPTGPSLPDAKPGWQWVSRGDVAVQVLESWPYSDYSWTPWCLGDAKKPTKPAGPYVDSPAGVIPAIACPEVGTEYVQMHLGFGPAGEQRTEVKAKDVGTGVHVVLDADPSAEETALADEILATAITFERDAAGCTPIGPFTSSEDRPSAWDLPNSRGMRSVGICRYSDNSDDPTRPNLLGSRLLTSEDEVGGLLDSIASAPEGVDGNTDECTPGYEGHAGVVLRVTGTNGVHEVYVRADGCRNLGYDDGTTKRKLNEECQRIFSQDPVVWYGGAAEAAAQCWTETQAPGTAEPAEPADPGTMPSVEALVRNSDLIIVGDAGAMTEGDAVVYDVAITQQLAGQSDTDTIKVVSAPDGRHLPGLTEPLLFLTRGDDGRYQITGGDQGIMERGADGRYTSVAEGRSDLMVDPADAAEWAKGLGADR